MTRWSLGANRTGDVDRRFSCKVLCKSDGTKIKKLRELIFKFKNLEVHLRKIFQVLNKYGHVKIPGRYVIGESAVNFTI